MMSSIARLEAIYADLEQEHKQVMKLLARLRDNADKNKLLSLLDELRTFLTDHFAREQLPYGFYDVLGELAATRRGELQALIDEHASILSHLNETLQHARSSPGVDKVGLVNRVSKLLEQLDGHEEREHLFVVDILRRDADSD